MRDRLARRAKLPLLMVWLEALRLCCSRASKRCSSVTFLREDATGLALVRLSAGKTLGETTWRQEGQGMSRECGKRPSMSAVLFFFWNVDRSRSRPPSALTQFALEGAVLRRLAASPVLSATRSWTGTGVR